MEMETVGFFCGVFNLHSTSNLLMVITAFVRLLQTIFLNHKIIIASVAIVGIKL
jgi:hypothetical protein